MSYHFSANQFDREFNPKRLGNWEVSKWYPERPRQLLHNTRIIADDRGHLLPGIPRLSDQPCERYITAWDYPRKITRQFAQEVTAPPARKVAAWVRQQRKQQGAIVGKEEDRQSRTSPTERGDALSPEEIAEPRSEEKTSEDKDAENKQPEASSPVTEKKEKSEAGSPPATTGNDIPSEAEKSPPSAADEIPSPITSKSSRATPTAERKCAQEADIKSKKSPSETPNGEKTGVPLCEPDVEKLIAKGKEFEKKELEGGSEYKGYQASEAVQEEMEDVRKANGRGLEVTGCGLGSPSPGGVKVPTKQGLDGISPLASSYTPFHVAKQFAEENLRHHPLPDMIEDPSYQLMESQRVKNPGAILPVPPRAVAVSIRHKNAGPTHCTKSSIFRTIKPPPDNPLTALAPLGGKDEDRSTKDYKPKISDIDLAIGWDICAPVKGEEQSLGHKVTGGTAPSVFAMVPLPSSPPGDCGSAGGCGTPTANGSTNSFLHSKGANQIEDAPCSSKQHTPPSSKPSSVPNSKPNSPPFSKHSSNQTSKMSSPSNSKPPSAQNSKPSTPTNQKVTHNKSSIRSWEQFRRPPIRKAWEEKENDSPNMISESPNQFRGHEIKTCMPNYSEPLPKANTTRKRRSQSSPNLIRNSVQPKLPGSNSVAYHKACTACNETTKSKTNASPKSSETNGYKMAFKAGKPCNNRPMTAHPSGSGSTSLTSQQDMKVKVPKPRAPFARRSYSIGTLAPPFSLWPGNHKRGGRDYPDHWRLASVYQHAFKPIPNRTRPLLATVYQ